MDADMDDVFGGMVFEEGAGGALLAVGSVVRVTVPEGHPPFHYIPGNLGILPPGETFLALVAGVVPAHEVMVPAPPAAEGSSAAAQRAASRAPDVATLVPDGYEVAALGVDSKLRQNGEAANPACLAALAQTALIPRLVVNCAWTAEVPRVDNLEARQTAASERGAVVTCCGLVGKSCSRALGDEEHRGGRRHLSPREAVSLQEPRQGRQEATRFQLLPSLRLAP